MFLKKQKFRLKLPRQLCLVQYWTVFFTGLKLIQILSIFLDDCGKREQQCSVCTGYNIKASFTVEPTEMLSVVFSESMEVLGWALVNTWSHHTAPLSHKHSIFYTLKPLPMCNFYIPSKFLVSNCSNNRCAWGCAKIFNSLASQMYPRPPQNLQIGKFKLLFPCLKMKSHQHCFTDQLHWCKKWVHPLINLPCWVCFHTRLSEGINYAFQSSIYAAAHKLFYVQEISYIFNHVTVRCRG